MANANIYQSIFAGQEIDLRLSEVSSLRSAIQDIVAGLSDTYTKAQVDAIAESIAAAVNATSGVVAATLPAASADTLGKIYYVGPTSGEYARYVTSYDGTTYSWLSIGTTDVDMTQYATKAEVSQLDQEITIQSVSPASSTYNRIIQAADGVIAAPSPANQNTNVVTFPVLPNTEYYIDGRVPAITGTCLCAFYDADGNYIANSATRPYPDYSGEMENVAVTSPAGAASVAVSGNASGSYGNTPAVRYKSSVGDLHRQVLGDMVVIRSWVTGKCMKNNQGVGNTCPKTAETYASHRYAVLPVDPKARYIINGTSTSTYRLWSFLNASNVILSVSDNVSSVGNKLVLTPPEGATQLIINNLNTDEGSYILYGADSGLLTQGDIVNGRAGGIDKVFSAEQGRLVWESIDEQEPHFNREIFDLTLRHTMTFTAGTNHSSTSDQLHVTLPKGAKFVARFVSGTAEFASTRSLYAFYADGTNESLGAMTRGNRYQFVAAKDIVAFGNYSSGSDITTSGTMTLEIWNNEGPNGVGINAFNNPIIVRQRLEQINKTSIISLLHFSDIHGDAVEFERIKQFKEKFSSLLSDAICTGDIVYDTYSSSFAFWGTNDILLALGNHDVWTNSSGTASETAANCYGKYFGNIGSWDVTSPGENLCYYYKDYTLGNNTVRLIVLDCMHMDSAQQTWVSETLASAKTAGATVIIASHYTPSAMHDMKFDRKSTFTAFEFNSTNTGYNTVVPIELLVKDFIDGGGKFACWICGHYHADVLGVSEHGQPVLCIDKADVSLANTYFAREAGSKSQDLFNVIAIDVTNQVVKVMRIGSDMDKFMRPVETVSFNYATKTAIWNCGDGLGGE